MSTVGETMRLGGTPRDDDRGIVDAQGKPARRAIDTRCPRCHASKDQRVLSGGFGAPHDVCGHCGHEFEERTL